MIRELKKATDEIEELYRKYREKEIEVLQQFQGIGVIGLQNKGDYRVQLDNFEDLKDIANGQELDFIYRGNEFSFPFELSFRIEDVEFLVILTEKDYQDYLESNRCNEADETETARAVLTEQERKMKEAGMKESDFR